MSRAGKIARRTFLIGSAAIAGGVAFGWYSYVKPHANPLAREPGTALTPYVLIDAAGVTIIAPRAEMGQGVHTTLAALVAEELDLPWDQVRVAHGPASAAYFNAGVLQDGVPFAPTDTGWLAEAARDAMQVPGKFLGFQITGGSSSTPDAFDKMRMAGAVARLALIGAAARRLGTGEAGLRTEGGAVVTPDGLRLTYTDLAAEAALVDLPAAPPLKPRADWTLLGKSLPRTDMLSKVTGTAIYTGDLRLPGMKFASVKTNPNLGAALLGHDATAALAMPGVERVIVVEGGVAVVADTTWTALRAVEAISFDWAPAAYPADTAAQRAETAASFAAARQDSRMRDDGDVDAALAVPGLVADYFTPYLAHATMEPMTAAAWLQDGRLEVWAGTQLPTQVLTEAGRLTGLPPEAVVVHTLPMGGGFGRRAEMDYIRQAIIIAAAVAGTPVLLTWSREEDMTHDAYRPMAMARVRGAVDQGRLSALDIAVAAPSVLGSQLGRLGYSVPGADNTIVQGAWEQPYDIPHCRVTGYKVPTGVPVGSWRAVGNSQNAFFLESAIDELAHLAGADPMQFRLAQMNHDPSRRVLQAVAEMSGWGQTTVPAGRARGVAFCLSFGVPVAQVIEVAQTDAGIVMTNAWAAVDVGVALDPSIIEAQVQGGMVFGLSAAINGEITFADGRVVQQNLWDYEPLRLAQCPPIAVRILENGPRIRGIGEPGTPPAAPALANAVFALTGQRIRSLPLRHAIRFA